MYWSFGIATALWSLMDYRKLHLAGIIKGSEAIKFGSSQPDQGILTLNGKAWTSSLANPNDARVGVSKSILDKRLADSHIWQGVSVPKSILDLHISVPKSIPSSHICPRVSILKICQEMLRESILDKSILRTYIWQGQYSEKYTR